MGKLRKKIRESLSAKVFLVTMLLLSAMGMLAYGLLAVLMPRTYSNTLNENLDRLAKDFISELKLTQYQDSGGLFAQFLQMGEISSVELYAENGVQVPVPYFQADRAYSAEVYEEGDAQAPAPSCQMDGAEGRVQQEATATYTEESGESSPILSNSYYFSF